MPENLVSRDGFSRPVPRQPAHLHTQAESGAYLRDSSRVPRRRPMKPPYAIGSVPSLSGHAIAYRWRSLPRVRRHRACKHQGSSERVLPWQVTMDQLIFASLSHTHYWYEVGMLKVPAVVGTPKHTVCCVCVCFLPIHSGHQVRWTYQPGSHRRKVTQDFSSTFFLRCVPQFFFARRIQPFLSLVDCEVGICALTISFSSRWAFLVPSRLYP